MVMMVIAIFDHPAVKDASSEMLHEFKTADFWQSAAYTPMAGSVGPNNMMVPQGYYPIQPIAMTNPLPGDVADKPVLIRKFGVEVVPISGGKVKITGVMGNSWAQKAKLQVGDILLSFNAKEIIDLKQFQAMVTSAAPEAAYKVVFYRNGRKMKCSITLGEGEMDGFTPIVVPK